MTSFHALEVRSVFGVRSKGGTTSHVCLVGNGSSWKLISILNKKGSLYTHLEPRRRSEHKVVRSVAIA